VIQQIRCVCGDNGVRFLVGCDEIQTEDLNDGQTYCGIKAVNPFK